MRRAEALNLGVALLEAQPAVDVGNLTGVAHAFEPPREEVERVPVFGVNDDFLVAVLRRAQ